MAVRYKTTAEEFFKDLKERIDKARGMKRKIKLTIKVIPLRELYTPPVQKKTFIVEMYDPEEINFKRGTVNIYGKGMVYSIEIRPDVYVEYEVYQEAGSVSVGGGVLYPDGTETGLIISYSELVK